MKLKNKDGFTGIYNYIYETSDLPIQVTRAPVEVLITKVDTESPRWKVYFEYSWPVCMCKCVGYVYMTMDNSLRDILEVEIPKLIVSNIHEYNQICPYCSTVEEDSL